MFFINITYLYLLYHSQHWIPCISSLVVGVEYMHIVHYINIHRYTGSTYIIHTCGMATKNKVYQIISSSNAQKKILFNIPNSPKSLATHLRPSRVILLAKPHLPGHFGSHRSIERVTRVWTVRHLGRMMHYYSQLI